MTLKIKELLVKVLQNLPTHYLWTPHLYDLNTFKVAGSSSDAYSIGPIHIMTINMDWLSHDYGAISIGTMLQIKNFTGYCWGGSIYVRGSIGTGKGYAIQPASGSVYLRDNITGTISKAYNGMVAGYILVVRY